MDLTRLLRPRSLAVVGASPRSFVGRIALENSRATGFAGPLVPVNGRYDEIVGFPTVGSVAELDAVPDVVLVQLATERVLGVVEDAVAAGVRHFVIPGGGFTDSGQTAKDLEAGLARLHAEHEIAVVGPNCMGVVDAVTGAAPYIGTVPPQLRRGRVAVAAQSGAVVEAMVNAGGRVPLSTAVSTGSEATTSLADYLRFFAVDDETDVVLSFVEGLHDPADFLDAARTLAEAGKLLVLCTVGRSETAQNGIAAHSGKLAPSARVATAAYRQAGAIVVEDLDELLAVGEILGTGRRPAGRRVHVVTNSGGEGNMLADLADDVGLELPPMSEAAEATLQATWPRFHVANPLDPWGVDDYPEVFPRAIAAAAAEPGDILVVSCDQQTTCGQHEKQLGRDLASYLSETRALTDKLPVFLSPSSQDPDPELTQLCRGAGIPLLRGARPALAALAAIATATPEPPVAVRQMPSDPRLLGRDPLTEDAALELLAEHGVTVPRQIRVATPEEAVAAAHRLGGPVVLKAAAVGLWHKSELGLVRVGLATADAVAHAGKEILEAARLAGFDASLLVVEMVRGELDVLVGFARDPQFGPTVMVGLGGVWAEHLDAVSVHVGAIDEAAARRLLSGSRVGTMMAQARGGALDVDGVVAALCTVSDLGHAHPDVVGIDVNPLIVGRDRAVAVDAVFQRTGDS